MSDPAPDLPPCGRLLPYAVHESRTAGGKRCGRPSVDLDGPKGHGEEPRCAIHRGVDKRTETNRKNRNLRNRLLAQHRPKDNR